MQYFQPAIDSIAKDMMREFNTASVPTVYNTYQCYLKDSRFRLNADIESARRQVRAPVTSLSRTRSQCLEACSRAFVLMQSSRPPAARPEPRVAGDRSQR